MSTSFNQTGKTVLSQSQFNARQQAGTLTEGEYLIKATGQPAMQVTAMPTSPTTGDIVQWVGATTASYTNGHFYKYNGSTWEEVSLGGSSYTAGDGITITDNEIAVKVGTGLFFDSNDAVCLNAASRTSLARADELTDTYINNLINTALGVVENGNY